MACPASPTGIYVLLALCMPASKTTGQAYRLHAGERTLVEPAKVTLRLTVFQICIDPVQIITVLSGIGIPR